MEKRSSLDAHRTSRREPVGVGREVANTMRSVSVSSLNCCAMRMGCGVSHLKEVLFESVLVRARSVQPAAELERPKGLCNVSNSHEVVHVLHDFLPTHVTVRKREKKEHGDCADHLDSIFS